MKYIKKRLILFAMAAALATTPLAPVSVRAEDVSEQTAVSQTSDAAANTDSTTAKNGWQGDRYYRDGKAVNGWQKIDGYYYYFKKHKVQRNTIAGTKAAGYYYVGADGIRVDEPVVNRAVQFVLKNSKKSDSRKKRLQDCCTAIRKSYYYHMSAATPKASDIAGCAEYMLKHHKGNCYRFASTMCYVAIVLGYKARVAAGGVTRYSGTSHLYGHGWCEIYIHGKWKIWDLSLQRKSSANLLNITHKEYPYHLRRNYLYKNTISKGKITWKRTKASWSNTKVSYIIYDY